jgi:hypothetical protein
MFIGEEVGIYLIQREVVVLDGEGGDEAVEVRPEAGEDVRDDVVLA